MRDLYETLGVDADASEDDIKRAYRRLSMTYHPDRRLDADEFDAAVSRSTVRSYLAQQVSESRPR